MNTVYFPIRYFEVPWPCGACADYYGIVVGTELRYIDIHPNMSARNKSLIQSSS